MGHTIVRLRYLILNTKYILTLPLQFRLVWNKILIPIILERN